MTSAERKLTLVGPIAYLFPFLFFFWPPDIGVFEKKVLHKMKRGRGGENYILVN